MRHLKALASLLTLLLVLARPAAGAAQATAQPETYRWDLGAALGMAGYLGDANDSRLFSHPSLSAAASLRYLINTRFALRALLTYSSLSGSTADMDNVIPSLREEPYSFKSSLTDFQVRGEYNFMPYGIGESYKQLRRFSPYLALGLGLSVGSCEGKSHAALSIPMAVGVKNKRSPSSLVMANSSPRLMRGRSLYFTPTAQCSTIPISSRVHFSKIPTGTPR